MNLYPILDDLKIQHRQTGAIVPWQRNWAQEEYVAEFHRQWNAQRPVRIIVLKARQLGVSTATGALAFSVCFMQRDTPALIIAHEMDGSEHLLGISKRYWETAWFRGLYPTKYLSRKHLSWEDNDSSIQIVTAKNASAGRSRTIRFIHGSEVGFWDNAQELMLGLRQTVPDAAGTAIVLESTANGVGNYFYKTWNAAVDGKNDYVPLFFPWWRHYEYRASFRGEGAGKRLVDMDEDERTLQRMMLDGADGRGKMDMETVTDALQWRRWAIYNLADGDVDRLKQEYPAHPEEAFIASGRNVFPMRKMQAIYFPMRGVRGRMTRDTTMKGGVRFQPDSTGPLLIFKDPNPDRDHGIYHIGGDPTGTTRGDMAVIQVINRRTGEQVARWRGRTDPGSFAEELFKLGRYYNDAMIATETTGPGQETIGRLIEMDYPRLWRNRWADKAPGILASTYGWPTTSKTKEWCIGHLLKLVVDGPTDIKVHDQTTFSEMRDYVTLEDKPGYGPASDDGFDDCVMSLAIAVTSAALEPPLSPYGTYEGPVLIPGGTGLDDLTDPDWWEDRDDDWRQVAQEWSHANL